MEVIIDFLVITACWILCSTALLPLTLILSMSKDFRDAWFSFFYIEIILQIFGHKAIAFRKHLFQLLEKHQTKTGNFKPLDILEIGVGGGANLEYYPENSNLTVLDINKTFETYLRANQMKFTHISYKGTIINRAESMTDVADSSYDAVVATYVLCSVQNAELSLKEVQRVLKPGGVYLFLEHVAHPKGTFGYYLQRYANPLCTIYFDGFNLDRRNKDTILKAGFKHVEYEEVCCQGFPVIFHPMVLGIAIK